MKKVLALMLALLMLVTLVACSKDEEEQESEEIDMAVTTNENVYKVENGDEFLYEYVGGDVKIVGFRGAEEPHDVIVPSAIHERDVVEIAASAFYNKTNIKSVTIPAGVEKIGDVAFANCSNLKSVSIPNTVYEIGQAAFAKCILIEEIAFTYPDQTDVAGKDRKDVVLGEMAFYGCQSLLKVTLPADLTEIADQTFMNCKSLMVLEWGTKIEKIGAYAFCGCKSLSTVTFPTALKEIGDCAFMNTALSSSWADGKGDLKVGDNVFRQVEIEENK